MIVETINFLLCIFFIWGLFLFSSFIYKNYFRARKNLKERYGDGLWILVTGATDGIGKEFCEQLAKENFNIILVARNEEKLNKVSEQIEKDYKVKTRTILFDFSEKTTLEEYEGSFGKLINQYDISILINNVGCYFQGLSRYLTLKIFKDVVSLNVLPQTLLTKIFTDFLSKRKKRSVIINVSSVIAVKPFPHVALYSPSKVYDRYLSRALAEEYANNNIDILCLMPDLLTLN